MSMNLKADNPTEQHALDYLNENGSDALEWKINTGKKTLAGSMAYAKDEAQKLMKSQKGSGYVMVDDATVFGWIIHFFEEDSIKEKATKAVAKTPVGSKKVEKPKPQKASISNPIVMDLFAEDPEVPFS